MKVEKSQSMLVRTFSGIGHILYEQEPKFGEEERKKVKL